MLPRFASLAVRVALLLACGLGAPAPAAQGQASYRFVAIHVVDRATQAPLPGVRVTVRGVGDRDWTSDPQGDVMLAVTPDRRAVLELRRIGYTAQTVDLPAGTSQASLTVALAGAVMVLDTTRVTTAAVSPMFAGFDGRRLRGAGSASFITREQIEKQLALRTVDIVRRAVSVRIVDSSGVLLVSSSRGPKTIISGTGKGGKGNDLAPCVMRVAVDGMMREWGYSVDDIDPKEIHGVEVYPGPATIPSEFSGMRKDAYCGLVMIWTRRGP
ncbi:MAG: hypothetical protein P3B98_07595 [Gemmatimonadota bacterium]|nr:hypothetical protein [Gemmatimonadota bacterium]